MAKKILFINYSYPFKPTAHNQCFLRMLRNLAEYNGEGKAELMVLALNCRPEDIRQYKGEQQTFTARYKNIPVKLATRTLRGHSAPCRAFELVKSWFLVKRAIENGAIDIVYAYGDNALFTLLFCRKQQEARLYFDCRGDFLSEQAYRAAGRLALWFYKRLYKAVVPRLDKIFTVSSTIRELFPMARRDCRFIPASNYFEGPVSREKPIQGPGSSVTFVYAGGLQAYQCLDRTLGLFAAYQSKYPARLLMAINGDASKLFPLLNSLRIDQSRIEIHSGLTPDKVADLLLKADCAFMLRENHALNNHAFPTKFAEYLAAGLPVVSTAGIHDTAKIIRDNRLGIIIDLDADLCLEAEKVRVFIAGERDIRRRCSDYAVNHLIWQNNINRIYQEIVT